MGNQPLKTNELETQNRPQNYNISITEATDEMPFFEDGFDAESHEEWVLKEAYILQRNQEQPLEKLKETLCELIRFYEQSAEKKKAEEVLMELLRGTQNFDVILLAMQRLVRLYKNYQTQYSEIVVSTIDQFLSDSTFSVNSHWQMLEIKADLYCAWKDRLHGITLLHDLASEIRSSNTDYWVELRLKLVNLYSKEKRYWEAESVLWETFEDLRNSQPFSELTERVVEEYLRFTRSVTDSHSDIIRTHIDRLLSVSEYLKSRSTSCIRSVLCAFLESPGLLTDMYAILDLHALLTYVLIIVQPKLTLLSIETIYSDIINVFSKRVADRVDIKRNLFYLSSVIKRSDLFAEKLTPLNDGIRLLLRLKDYVGEERVYVHLRNSYQNFGNRSWDAYLRRLYK